MPLLQVLSGAVLLFFGRTLYWLFVGLAGFLLGAEIASSALAQEPAGLVLLAGVVAGITGALLAMLLQRVAFVLGGFFAGGYLAVLAARSLGADPHALTWAWFALGGIIGALAAAWLMDWAIVALSSLAGAAAIVGAFQLGPPIAATAFVVLTALGFAIQGRSLPGSRPGGHLRPI
jgi:hypothetical protein